MSDPVKMLPGFTWDKKLMRYRVLTPGYGQKPGTIISREKVMAVLEDKVATGKETMANLTVAFNEGQITAKQFMVAGTSHLKTLYIQQAALGAGGWDKLGPSDWGRVGGNLKAEYRHLARFVHEIATADPKLTNKQVASRARSYAGRARAMFWQATTENERELGKDQERRILGPTDHCKVCLGYTAQGWQVIGFFPSPGTNCEGGGNCGCSKIFRTAPDE